MVDSNLLRRSFSSNAEETPFTMFYSIAKYNSCDLLSNYWGSKRTWGLFFCTFSEGDPQYYIPNLYQCVVYSWYLGFRIAPLHPTAWCWYQGCSPPKMRPETPRIAMSNSSFCNIAHQFLGKIEKLTTLWYSNMARKSPMRIVSLEQRNQTPVTAVADTWSCCSKDTSPHPWYSDWNRPPGS